MKLNALLTIILLSISAASYAQGYLPTVTHKETIRITSMLGVNGPYLAVQGDRGQDIRPLNFGANYDLVQFGRKYAPQLHSNRAIYCSVNVREPLLTETDEDKLSIDSIRLCMNENGRIIESNISTFENVNQIVREDRESLIQKIRTPVEYERFGLPNEDRLVIEKPSAPTSSIWSLQNAGNQQ